MAKVKNTNNSPDMNGISKQDIEDIKWVQERSKNGSIAEGLELFNMNWHIFSLLQNEPFFAAISRHVHKTPTLSIETAGVRITSEGYYEMIYNPYFFHKLTKEQRLGVIKHELYHLIFEHVSTRLPEGGLTKEWNIATDLAINSHIANELPSFACVPGKGQYAQMPSGKSAEWYFAEVSKNKGKNGEGEGGMPNLDDHSGWGENNENLDPSVKEIAKQRVKEMMKDAAEESNRNGNNWGSITADMRQEILDRIMQKVNWRNVLRYFIKTSQRANKTNTVRRLNKRFPYIHAGVKVERRANIAISIDQSGSVSDELLVKFFSELNGLSKLATFTVVPFDTEVDEKLVYVWKKGKHEKAKRVKCGGTDFNAPTGYVNSRHFDGHIVLTDMCAPKPIASDCQRMWMTSREHADQKYFATTERVIVID